VGQGTGLGLSTVHGIVTGMGGELTIESELEVGTSVLVSFPRAERRQEPSVVVDHYVDASLA
jgi:two-component system, NtrC family, sensor kinase